MRGSRRTLLNAPVASAFSPLSLSPVLWLRADAGLWQDAAMTTPVTTNNDPVGAWADQSGAAHHAVQSTSAERPPWKTNSVNGQPAVDCTSGLWLGTALFAASLPQPYSITVVYYPTDSNARVMDNATGTGNRVIIGQYNAQYYLRAGTGLFVGTTGSAWVILTGQYNSTASAVFANGVSQGTGDAGTLSFDRAFLAQDGLGNFLPCTIGQIVVWGSLSGRSNLEGYLATIYGITLG